MKYIITIFIALGFVLSSVLGVEYICEGEEMFPVYTGSPFVFRVKSLGSSLTYYYSISGLVLNTAIWTGALLFVQSMILRFIKAIGNSKPVQVFYTGLIGVMIVFATFNVAINYIMLGSGFDKHGNYWYFDLDKDSKTWGVVCEGKWGMFLFPG